MVSLNGSLVMRIEADRIELTDRFALTLQRTLRVPDDGREYRLPPGLGRFPVYRVAAFRDRLPSTWSNDDLFIPMYQREALWLGFDAAPWKPSAAKVGIGTVNAVSGESWDERLTDSAQDYVVCPPQLWLDGINAGEGSIRQFVAMPLGSGVTVEGQVLGRESAGGIQLLVFDPRPGLFPDQPPPLRAPEAAGGALAMPAAHGGSMGVAAGGVMRQRIYPDPHGVGTWQEHPSAAATVRILNSDQFRHVTGQAPPSSPIDTKAYIDSGLPWFELYDEDLGTLSAPERLRRVKSIDELSRNKPEL